MPIDDFYEAAVKAGGYAFDTEYEPHQNMYSGNFTIHGCSFATDGDYFYCSDLPAVRDLIRQLFSNPDLEAVAHNAKSDLKSLVQSGTIEPYKYPEKLVDTMMAENLLFDNLHPQQIGLKPTVKRRYGYEMMDFFTAYAFGMDSPEFAKYSAEDAQWEYRLWLDQKHVLEKDGLLPLLQKILFPACKVFVDIENFGFKWDIDRASELLSAFIKLRDELEAEIHAKIGYIDLASGDQLAQRLFHDLGYSTKGIQLTKTGKRFAVDAEAMDVLAPKYPVCEAIRKQRNAAKMVSTYIVPVTQMATQDPHSRIHPSFWQASSTGRTRSSDPNLQNIPTVSDDFSIREAFISEEGCKLIIVDYSQIELRLVAHITDDPIMLKAYLDYECTKCGATGSSKVILHECPNCGQPEDEEILKDKEVEGFWHGLDLHAITANSIEVLRGSRRWGKTANFAMVYGASGYRMHMAHPALSIDDWDEVKTGYLQKYQGVYKWHLMSEARLKSGGVCKDLFGRKRRFTKADIRKSEKHALNQFVNFAPQSSACHLGQMAMVKLREKWLDNGWGTDIKIVNFVHDEVVFECREDKLDLYIPEIRSTMETCVQFKVPIRVDIKVSEHWNVKG